jgi:hypothetical protein
MYHPLFRGWDMTRLAYHGGWFHGGLNGEASESMSCVELARKSMRGTGRGTATAMREMTDSMDYRSGPAMEKNLTND